MATVGVLFKDGPCDGQYKLLTDDKIRAGAVSCGGTNYKIIHVGPNAYEALTAKLYEQTTQFTSAQKKKQIDTAWMTLMRTFHDKIPANDKRANATIAKIRKAVR